MKAIIIGAGQVGRGLAETLCLENRDVVFIDQDEERLKPIIEKLDLLTIEGNGASAKVLAKADVLHANLLLAVTNSVETNVLACRIAKMMNPAIRTICRIAMKDYFSEEHGVSAEHLGIDAAVVPHLECAKAIVDAVHQGAVREISELSAPGAVICGFRLQPGSPIVGCQIGKFPRPELIGRTRFAAISRRGRIIFPREGERFNNYDEVYAAGPREEIEALVEWSQTTMEKQPRRRAVIAGAGNVGLEVAVRLHSLGWRVAVIEQDRKVAEAALDALPAGIELLQGNPSNAQLMEELGVAGCRVFIAASRLDETNVLSCLLARRLGAAKVIALINKADYRAIIASMDNIDCCFSPRIAALNTILNLVQGSERRVGALLHRLQAEIFELSVDPTSEVAGKTLAHHPLPDGCTLAARLRGNTIVPASNEEFNIASDRVVLMGEAPALRQAQKLFLPR
ncbi:MAG: Trk system potassium transporter TrkA [Verrucomicrobiota bacterium]|jgi:trk system potassium uptake protein TrkA